MEGATWCALRALSCATPCCASSPPPPAARDGETASGLTEGPASQRACTRVPPWVRRWMCRRNRTAIFPAPSCTSELSNDMACAEALTV